MLNVQPSHGGHGTSPLYSSYIPTSPETSDNGYAYFGNVISQGIASGHGPASWAYQQKVYCRRRESGNSDLLQSRSEPISHPEQRYAYHISPHGSNTDSSPDTSPIGHMSSSSGALSFPYSESYVACTNCRSQFHVRGVIVSYQDQRGVNATADWGLQGAKSYFSPPTEGNVQSSGQGPTQDTGDIAPHGGLFDVPALEPPTSRVPIRNSAATNVPNEPVIVHAREDVADNGLPKKRKRKRRTMTKPRKQRTLTDKGKAHAKAVRDCPGGACADCRRKKTKARDPLVTNLVFNTNLTVLSALTSCQRIYPRSRMINGLQTLHGLIPQHRIMALKVTTLYSIDHPWRTILSTKTLTEIVCAGEPYPQRG